MECLRLSQTNSKKSQILFYMKLKALLFFFITCFFCTKNDLQAQDKAQFSGDLQLNTKYFDADSLRGAIGTPFYDYLFYSADAWLNLKYQYKGFDVGVRFDVFHNSFIFNPTRETSKEGLAYWYINKKVKKLDITAGYFYEQFGSGITFRTYEARALGIDQSVLGIRLGYELNDNWRIKAFTGKAKNNFDFDNIELFQPIVKGINLEGFVNVSEKVQLVPGFSAVNRTIDAKSMQSIALEINSYPSVADRFEPKYNTNAISVYNTLQFGNFSWFVEGAIKTEDVLRSISGQLFNPSLGFVGYSTLTYSQKGLGIVVQGKYTDNYDFRVSPIPTANAGLLNFLPPMAQQTTYRLTSRYNAATQTLGELAWQADVTYTPKKGYTLNGNFSNISTLENELLFREIYLDLSVKLRKRPWKGTVGLQTVDYNRFFFEQKGDFVNTLTPFTEFVYKFTKKQSLKTELSYMITKRNYRFSAKEDPNPEKLQDFGDWFWILLEYSIAPNWSFSVADMYRMNDGVHYPTFFASYSQKTSRFALSYAKQPDGIVCTGGVCRYEPAFSGVKFDITTSF